MATWLVPFLTGIVKGFVAEIGRPDDRPAASQRPATIVASGRVGGLIWMAVPYAQADVFKAGNPDAYPVEAAVRYIARQQFSDPECYQALQPFMNAALDAVEQYGESCRIFVAKME